MIVLTPPSGLLIFNCTEVVRITNELLILLILLVLDPDTRVGPQPDNQATPCPTRLLESGVKTTRHIMLGCDRIAQTLPDAEDTQRADRACHAQPRRLLDRPPPARGGANGRFPGQNRLGHRLHALPRVLPRDGA